MNKDIIRFLKRISRDNLDKVEINENYSHSIKLEDIEKYNGKTGICFLGNVENPLKRNRDNDIIEKHYIMIDVDVRKNFKAKGKDITDDEIKEIGGEIVAKLEQTELLKDWGYIVYSGNGIHIYYVGKGKKYNPKDYENALQYIHNIWNTIFQEELHCDIAVKNIGRIMRLPGTINEKNGQKVEILFENDVDSKLVEDIEELAKKWKSISKAYDEIKQEETKNIIIYKKEFKQNGKLLEELQDKVDIIDLILQDYSELEARDSNNPNIISLYDTKERTNIGAFVFKREKILYHTGSTRIPNTKKAYNVYTYLREIRGWTHKEIIEFAKKYGIETETKKEVIIKTISKDENLFDNITGADYTLGLDVLDNTFGMFKKGQTIMIYGEAGMGKTEFAFFQAIQNAKKGKKVCYLTLEMTPKEMLFRTGMKRAGVSVEEYNKYGIPATKRSLFDKKVNEILSIKNLHLIDIDDKSISGVIETIKKLSEEGFELFYIDNLGMIWGDNPYQKELDIQNEISRKLTNIAKEYNIAIVIIHHEKKSNEKKVNNKKRGLGGMRGSQKLVDDRDLIIRVWRDKTWDEEDIEDMEEERATVEISVLKNRTLGIEGTKKIYFKDGLYYETFNS